MRACPEFQPCLIRVSYIAVHLEFQLDTGAKVSCLVIKIFWHYRKHEKECVTK